MDVHDMTINQSEPCRRLNFEGVDDPSSQVDNNRQNKDEVINIISIENDMNDHTNMTNGETIEEIHAHIPKELIPRLGMEFVTEDDAYKFYMEYAKAAGFGTRISKGHKDKFSDKMLDRIFCCSRQGERKKNERAVNVRFPRPLTRCHCPAEIKINCRQTDTHQIGLYRIVRFIAEHNHDCVTPSKCHLFRSHRKMTDAQKAEVDAAASCGITPRETMELMAKQVGGPEHLGFIYDDCKNYLCTKRMTKMELGDTRGVLEYLQRMQAEDPNFFYAIQVDEDALITNIFCTDAKMKADYSHFGDVVCFDTTYRKHKDGRPIALLVGVNNHKQTVVFGAALLYDETAITFSWLFDTFASAMSEKKPQTILTDQDKAMAKALASRWPETYHRLCVWHINQNAATHLSSVFAKYKDFANDFSTCIYDYEDEDDFITAWNEMIEKYGLQENEWLTRLFELRKKWALVYGRETFCADMSTTQRSESMNAVIKRYVSYKNDLSEFFEHFERMLKKHRYEERRANFRTSQSRPYMPFPVQILKHAESIYTLEIFELFHFKVCKAHDCKMEIWDEQESKTYYKVTPFGKNYHHLVTYDSVYNSITCSCKKFEFIGILCSHALKVLTQKNIVRIPDPYIKNRWKKNAKKRKVEIANTDLSQVDPEERMSFQYKDLCQLYGQLITRAAESEKSYKIAKEGLLKLLEQVDASFEETEIDESFCDTVVVDAYVSQPVEAVENGVTCKDVRGIKSKEKVTYKTSKRPKSALERSKYRRRTTRGLSKLNTKFSTSEESEFIDATLDTIPNQSLPTQASQCSKFTAASLDNIPDQNLHIQSSQCSQAKNDKESLSMVQLDDEHLSFVKEVTFPQGTYSMSSDSKCPQQPKVSMCYVSKDTIQTSSSTDHQTFEGSMTELLKKMDSSLHEKHISVACNLGKAPQIDINSHVPDDYTSNAIFSLKFAKYYMAINLQIFSSNCFYA